MPYLLEINTLTNIYFMKNTLLFLVLLLFGLGCKNDQSTNSKSKNGPKTLTFSTNQFQDIFDKNDIKGAFILYDLINDTALIFNQPRTERAYLPASTFKIINSLIALETGVIKDENEMIQWDGEERFVETWNQDHNLRSGIKYSVVWFYQELARRIGEERMQKFH